VLSIETLLDISTMSVEEVTGRLAAAEEDQPPQASSATNGGKLLLTEEEWLARMQSRLQIGSGSSGEKKTSNLGPRRPCGKDLGKGAKEAGNDQAEKKGKCHYCGNKGH